MTTTYFSGMPGGGMGTGGKGEGMGKGGMGGMGELPPECLDNPSIQGKVISPILAWTYKDFICQSLVE